MKREDGNVGDIMVTGICIIAMLLVMVSYIDIVGVLEEKEAVGQIARKYILKMETVGVLTQADKLAMIAELENAGVTEVELEGTTLSEVAYGEPIVLQIHGKLRGEYDFSEKRVSTAKN